MQLEWREMAWIIYLEALSSFKAVNCYAILIIPNDEVFQAE